MGRGEGLWRIRDCFGEFRFNVINLSTNLRMKQMSEGFPLEGKLSAEQTDEVFPMA